MLVVVHTRKGLFSSTQRKGETHSNQGMIALSEEENMNTSKMVVIRS
jgi:hypothetical protein